MAGHKYSAISMAIPTKSASDFVSDLLDGQLHDLQSLPLTELEAALQTRLEKDYQFSAEEFSSALLASRQQLEASIGIPLTDEQMSALAGGKSKAASVGAEVGGTAGSVAAVLGVVGMAVTLMVK